MYILFGIIIFKASRSQNERHFIEMVGGFEAPVLVFGVDRLRGKAPWTFSIKGSLRDHPLYSWAN